MEFLDRMRLKAFSSAYMLAYLWQALEQ